MLHFPVPRALFITFFIISFLFVLALMSLSAFSHTEQHIPEPYLVKDIYAGDGDAHPTYMTNVNGTIFMFATDENGRGVWVTNATQDDANFVTETNPNAVQWAPMPTPYATPAANFGRPVGIEDNFFYINDDGNTGLELWVSNGSPTGTMMVEDIEPGTQGSQPGSLTALNAQLLLRAWNKGNDSWLWKTDGTITNTQAIHNLTPGESFSYPHNLVNVNNIIYFRANHETLGDSIWRTDGTSDGTWMVVDVLPDDNSNSNYDDYIFSSGNLIYFVVYHPDYGREFWRSDGTESGTWLLKDIVPGTGSSLSWVMTTIDLDGIFYFYAGTGLWRTDGSTENTVLVKEIGSIERMAKVNGRLFFTAFDDTHGQEMWTSDGTESGTYMVADINPTGSSIVPGWYVVQDYASMNKLYFFAADDGVHGTELWQSDGTEASTIMIMDINPGSASSNPRHFEVADNTLYFSADDGVHGVELWALSYAALARDDYVITRMEQPIMINVLENDIYLNPDQLVVTQVSDPQHGTTDLNSTNFIYTPDTGYIGLDSFSYTISDGTNEPRAATVTITVEGDRLYLPVLFYKFIQD